MRPPPPAPDTSSRPPHVFLSAFRITCSDAEPHGRLVPWEGPHDGPVVTGRLRDCLSERGRYYEERHLEEWVSRHPQAIFPGRTALVLGSQNYAHLGEKIDLLVVEEAGRFHVAEFKVERVARNGGVTPDRIQGQMTRYVDFLSRTLAGYPASLAVYYARFAAAFGGSAGDLGEELRRVFGRTDFPLGGGPPVICRTFVTEGYDEYAVASFRRLAQGDGPVRLIYYRFQPAGQRIEFWEVPLTVDGCPP